MSLRWALCTFLLLSLATPLFANEITGEGETTTTTTTTNNNQPAIVTQTTPSTVVSPHVAAVKVARAYSDEYDEDEDADDDEFPFRLPPAPVASAPTPAKPCPKCSKRSIDERIAQKKFRIEQLKALLAKQRAQHAATSKMIADRNREIQARVRAHQQEMVKAADIQRRRANLQRAEQTVNARKAAAKRAADAKAARQLQVLQNQLAAQRRASIVAQQALERQEREDVTRRRVIATQHKHYQKLDAELKAHEAEWIRTRGKLPKITKTVRKVPRAAPRAVQPRRRRLLSPKLRRWIIIRTIQQRRLTVRPAVAPSITAARASYQTARNNLKNSLKTILSQRMWKRRAALAAFRKLSEQLSITAAMAQAALVRAHRSINRKLNIITRRIGTIQRQRQRQRQRKPRRWSIRPKRRIQRRRRVVKKFTPKTKWYQRKPKSAGPIRRLKAKWNKKWNKNKPRRNIRFKFSSKPYPKLVSTRDAKLTEVGAEVQNNQHVEQKQV